MQGGVCYNKAVPIAMAALTGKEIIVPLEPGLMGAFGVALEIKKRIELGFIQEQNFDLDGLINRKVEYGKSFICAGGAEKCDRKCSIAIIEIENKNSHLEVLVINIMSFSKPKLSISKNIILLNFVRNLSSINMCILSFLKLMHKRLESLNHF